MITNHITEMLPGAIDDMQHQWQFPIIIDSLESVLCNSNYSILPHQSIPICVILKCILPVLRTRQNLLSSSDNKSRIYTCDKNVRAMLRIDYFYYTYTVSVSICNTLRSLLIYFSNNIIYIEPYILHVQIINPFNSFTIIAVKCIFLEKNKTNISMKTKKGYIKL